MNQGEGVRPVLVDVELSILGARCSADHRRASLLWFVLEEIRHRGCRSESTAGFRSDPFAVAFQEAFNLPAAGWRIPLLDEASGDLSLSAAH
jgi:hypothetical protein